MTLIGAREDEGRRSLRRWIGASAAAHAGLVALLAWSPLPSARTDLPPVVRVDLMARAPSAGPSSAAPPPQPEPEPAPEPAPAPPPEPEPAPPEPAETVLPETPQQPPEREPEPEPAPEPEAEPPEAEPEEPPEPEPPEPETTPAREAPREPSARERALAEERRRRGEGYDDVLAQLRSEEGEPAEEAGASAPAAREGRAGGPGVPVSAEERAWIRKAKVHVKRSWLLPAGLQGEPLEAEVKVQVGPGGEVLSAEIVRGSGNPFYDDFVERAVRKASPFPEPPEAAEWRFVFRPRELRR